MKDVSISEVLETKKALQLCLGDSNVIIESGFNRVTEFGTELWAMKIGLTKNYLIMASPVHDCVSCHETPFRREDREAKLMTCLCLQAVPFSQVSISTAWAAEILTVSFPSNQQYFKFAPSSSQDASWVAWNQMLLKTGADGEITSDSDFMCEGHVTLLHNILGNEGSNECLYKDDVKKKMFDLEAKQTNKGIMKYPGVARRLSTVEGETDLIQTGLPLSSFREWGEPGMKGRPIFHDSNHQRGSFGDSTEDNRREVHSPKSRWQSLLPERSHTPVTKSVHFEHELLERVTRKERLDDLEDDDQGNLNFGIDRQFEGSVGLFGSKQQGKSKTPRDNSGEECYLFPDILLPKSAGLCLNEEFVTFLPDEDDDPELRKAIGARERYIGDSEGLSDEEKKYYLRDFKDAKTGVARGTLTWLDIHEKADVVLCKILEARSEFKASFPASAVCPNAEELLGGNLGLEPRHRARMSCLKSWSSEYFLPFDVDAHEDCLKDGIFLSSSERRELNRNASLLDLATFPRVEHSVDSLHFVLVGDMGFGLRTLPEDFAGRRMRYFTKIELFRYMANRAKGFSFSAFSASPIHGSTEHLEELRCIIGRQSLKYDSTTSFPATPDKRLTATGDRNGRPNDPSSTRTISDYQRLAYDSTKGRRQVEWNHLNVKLRQNLPHCKLCELIPRTLALEVTRIDQKLFLALQPSEVARGVIRPHTVDSLNCPNLWRLLQFSIRLAHIVTSEILTKVFSDNNSSAIAFFVEMAARCCRLGNMQSTLAVLAAILSPSVVRLETAWNDFQQTYPDHYWTFVLLIDKVLSASRPVKSEKDNPFIPHVADLFRYMRENYSFLMQQMPPPSSTDALPVDRLGISYTKVTAETEYKSDPKKKSNWITTLSAVLGFKLNNSKKTSKGKGSVQDMLESSVPLLCDLKENIDADKELEKILSKQKVRPSSRILSVMVSLHLKSLKDAVQKYQLKENPNARAFLRYSLYRLPGQNMKLSKRGGKRRA